MFWIFYVENETAILQNSQSNFILMCILINTVVEF